MRASGVFTGTTNSPSHSPRQSLYHSTIRAGRNLPDKEFRYLRTVIVTAAVHRGFSSSLRPCGLSPCFNLPAPGRCHPLYVVFDFAESCVFVKQLQSKRSLERLWIFTLSTCVGLWYGHLDNSLEVFPGSVKSETCRP